MSRIWFSFFAYALFLSAPSTAQSQATAGAINTQCPTAGTVVQIKSGVGIIDRTYEGVDRSKQHYCKYRNDNRPSISLYFGMISTNASDEERNGFLSLMEGRSSDFSLNTTARITGGDGGQAGVFDVKRTWKRMGGDSIAIGGKPVPAVIFEVSTQSQSGHIYQLTQRFWLDPATGIWVRGQTISSSGIRRPSDWEVISIH